MWRVLLTARPSLPFSPFVHWNHVLPLTHSHSHPFSIVFRFYPVINWSLSFYTSSTVLSAFSLINLSSLKFSQITFSKPRGRSKSTTFEKTPVAALAALAAPNRHQIVTVAALAALHQIVTSWNPVGTQVIQVISGPLKRGRPAARSMEQHGVSTKRPR